MQNPVWKLTMIKKYIYSRYGKYMPLGIIAISAFKLGINQGICLCQFPEVIQ